MKKLRRVISIGFAASLSAFGQPLQPPDALPATPSPTLVAPDVGTSVGVGVATKPVFFIDSFGPYTMMVPGQQNGADAGVHVGVDTTKKSISFQSSGLKSGSLKDYDWSASLLAEADADADLGRILDGDVDPTWNIGGGAHFIQKLSKPGDTMKWLKLINVVGVYKRESVETGTLSTTGSIIKAQQQKVDGTKLDLQLGGIAQSDSWIGKIPGFAGNLSMSAAVGYRRGSNADQLEKIEFEGRDIRVGELKTVNRYPLTTALALASHKESKVTKAINGILALIPGAKIDEGVPFVPVYGAFFIKEIGDGPDMDQYGLTLGFRVIKNGRYSMPLRLALTKKQIGDKESGTQFGVTAVMNFFD